MIKVRPPSRDIFSDCYVFNNMFKFVGKNNGEEGEDEVVGDVEEQEGMILKAEENVKSSRAQMLLSIEKEHNDQVFHSTIIIVPQDNISPLL